MAQFEPPDGLGDPARFIGIERKRFGGIDRAEAARAGTALPGDHEGGGPGAPTFPTVGTLGFFANGHQVQIGDKRLGRMKHGAGGEPDSQPVGFPLLMERRVYFHNGGSGVAASKTGATLYVNSPAFAKD